MVRAGVYEIAEGGWSREISRVVWPVDLHSTSVLTALFTLQTSHISYNHCLPHEHSKSLHKHIERTLESSTCACTTTWNTQTSRNVLANLINSFNPLEAGFLCTISHHYAPA